VAKKRGKIQGARQETFDTIDGLTPRYLFGCMISSDPSPILVIRFDLRETPPCPLCADGLGVPVLVESSQDRADLTFSCRRCAFEWTVQVPDESVPKPATD
jgi:hypothetical protein